MTVVKTVGVRGEAHIASLRAYLEDDRARPLVQQHSRRVEALRGDGPHAQGIRARCRI